MYLKLNLALTLCLAFILPTKTEDRVAVPYIVGGVTTTIPASNSLASVYKNGNFLCGGSLVSNQHVVTAARCVRGNRPRNLTVRAGSSFRNQGQILQVIRTTVPSSFNASTNNMDVAVLKLRAPVNSTIRPIPQCTRILNKGERVQIFGWGRTSSTNTTLPLQVRTATFPLITRAECQRRFSTNRAITSNMMCANTTMMMDVCTMDAGGPVIARGQLCGVISRDSSCAAGSPQIAVFTRVFANRVRTFIKNAIAT